MNDGKTVLASINALRFCGLSQDDFWQAFIEGACQLCHSPVAALLIDDGEWGVQTCHVVDGGALSSPLESLLLRSGATLAERAGRNGFAFEPVDVKGLISGVTKPVVLAIALGSLGQDEQKTLLLMLMDRQNTNLFNEYVVRSQLISDIPASYHFYRSRQLQLSSSSESHLIDSMKIISQVMRQKKFVLACMILVNELSSKFSCVQVSVGWKNNDYVSPIAISHVEKIARSTNAVQRLEAVFEESLDQDQEILYPSTDSSRRIIVDAHKKYAFEKQDSQILSLPLRLDGVGVGVITCEKHEGDFSEQQLMMLRLTTSQITRFLSDLYYQDRWFASRIILKCKRSLSWWLGMEYTWIKLAAIFCSALVLYVVLFDWEYKVDAAARLATDDLRYLSVPFNGYVHDVNVHAGDWVKQGDVLLRMDKEELYLQESEALADVRRFTRESEKSRAMKAFADMRVADARVKQAEARLSRVRYYLKQSDVVAPFDGVVVQGDKKQLLGAPVSKGDLLFKVAQLKKLYVKIKLGERDIEDVSVGKHAGLMLLSKPGERIPVVIDRIIPMAEVESEKGNTFTVEARFIDAPKKWWRPGMSGEVKIDVGQRPVIWILTHRTVEFLRMYFWW